MGSDTAYQDADMPDEEVAWLKRILDQAGKHKVVLFSHHQPFSLLDIQNPNLVRKLETFLDARRIFACYWGHEHRCVLYDQHPKWRVRPLCGAPRIPYFRDTLGPVVNDLTFKILRSDGDVPGGAILMAANLYVTADPAGYGPAAT